LTFDGFSVLVKRTLIFLHRWTGVALCLLFLLWFVSGIVMMYWDFPSVRAEDRLERSPSLEAFAIQLSPVEAYAKVESQQSGMQIRLNMFDGRPVYRFRAGRGERMIYADSGEEQLRVSAEMAGRIASAWTAQPVGAAKTESLQDVDQWTVQGGLRNLRPLWKYSWPNGEQVYVSGASGEVVQYTTSASRFWAYLGAIPHWLYFTPLRKHQPEWSRLVIWTSGIGAVVALMGIAIGVWMYSFSKRYQYDGVPTSLPYRGPKRWHAILGLIFGAAAASWAFSGMLSMDPFPTRGGRAGANANISGALRGRFQIAAFEPKHPREALKQLADLKIKEIELTSFAGQAVYLATAAQGDTRIIPVQGQPIREFGTDRVIEAVKSGVSPDNLAEVSVAHDYDAYYLDRRHERPLPIVVVRLNDADQTRYYIDPKTARIAGTYSSRAWVSRWLYHGLHSFDFPWLYKYRPLWDIVVISFMLGGTALCITSLILAWRVLRRKVAELFGAEIMTHS